MADSERLERIEGAEQAYVNFSHIDMNAHLKLDAYIEMCLPKNFANIEKHFDMLALRKQGVWPIPYYINIHTTPQPIGFAHPVHLQHKTLLRRHVTEQSLPQTAQTEQVDRLFYDLSTHITAHESIGSAENLGMGEQSQHIVSVGTIQMLQIFTKPLAPPDQRRVTQVPQELQRFQETPWHKPFPTYESLKAFPADYEVANIAPSFHSVWGFSNTDPNQHVTLTEYMMGIQNHLTRMLFQAKKPVTEHFVHQAEFVFRKPFFPGQCYGIQGKLGFCEDQTILLAGIHLSDSDGTLAPKPSIFSRMEGSFCLKKPK